MKNRLTICIYMKCNFFHKTYRTLFSTFYRRQNIKFRQKLVKLQDLVVTAENDTTAVSRYCFVKFHMFISSPADGLFHEPLCISLVINFSISSCKPVKQNKKKKKAQNIVACAILATIYLTQILTYCIRTYAQQYDMKGMLCTIMYIYLHLYYKLG